MRFTRLPLCVFLGLGALGCPPVDDDPPFGSGEPTPSATPFVAVDGQEHEPNGDAAQANDIALGQALSASLSPQDVDFFTLSIPQDFGGHKITLSAYDGDGLCFEGTDPNLELFDAAGISLAFVEDSFEHYCPILHVAVTPGETYRIKIATDYTLSGPYVISAEVGGPGTLSGRVGPQPQRVAPPMAARGEIAPGEGILALTPGTPRAQALDRARRVLPGLTLRQEVMGGRYLHVTFPLLEGGDRRGETLARLGALGAVPGIASVAPNGVLHPQDTTPDDPYFRTDFQWHYFSFPGINLPLAWDISTGLEEVIVAVIDTGHDVDHEDLAGKSAPGYDFISNITSAGDGDGSDDDPADALRNGHGTHVAGTVAADTDNGIGVAAVGWRTRYMPLRVCGDFGCTEADITNAIYYAAGFAVLDLPGQGAPRAEVINMSLGGHDLCSPLLQEAITAARNRGVVVVVAAGNSGDVAAEYSPAGCAGVIAVAATDNRADLASFSNYGEAVDIAAPGVAIVSTFENNTYAALQGTSMASPHVAGAAALVKSLNPTLGFEGVVALMRGTAAPLSCGARSCGAGLLDVGALLEAAIASADAAAEAVVLVEAVSEDGAVFTTVAQGESFLLSALPPGVYSLRAGIEVNGDLTLDPGEIVGTGDGLYVITAKGEDYTGAEIVVP